MEIFFEKKPDHYHGDDVSITIHHNSRGAGMAEHIANEIQKIVSKQPINQDRVETIRNLYENQN